MQVNHNIKNIPSKIRMKNKYKEIVRFKWTKKLAFNMSSCPPPSEI